MTRRHFSLSLAMVSLLATGCATTCGPGTVETDGGGWGFDRDGFGASSFSKVCLPISPVSDCTVYQMKEEDGGGWGVDRDGGGWGIDRDGGGWGIERDGAGWYRKRTEPHHPGDAGDPELKEITYVPGGVCRIGVEPLPLEGA